MTGCSRSASRPTPSTPVPSSGRGRAPRRVHDERAYGRISLRLHYAWMAIVKYIEKKLSTINKTLQNLLLTQHDQTQL